MSPAQIHRLPTTDEALLPLALRLEDLLHARFPGITDRSRVAVAHADGAVEVRLKGLALSASEASAATGFLAAVTGAAHPATPPASASRSDTAAVFQLHRRAS